MRIEYKEKPAYLLGYAYDLTLGAFKYIPYEGAQATFQHNNPPIYMFKKRVMWCLNKEDHLFRSIIWVIVIIFLLAPQVIFVFATR
jgi:hypothetical protein